MIAPLVSHKKYVRFVRHKRGQYGGFRTDHRHFEVWRKLEQTNLDMIYAELSSLYAIHKGRPSRELDLVHGLVSEDPAPVGG